MSHTLILTELRGEAYKYILAFVSGFNRAFFIFFYQFMHVWVQHTQSAGHTEDQVTKSCNLIIYINEKTTCDVSPSLLRLNACILIYSTIKLIILMQKGSL